MHTKLSHLRHSWLTPGSRLHSFKLTEVMENWPKFSYLVGKWGKYSHVHLYCTSHRWSNFWEEPLGSCSLQAVKGERIFHPSKAFPALPVQQLLLFKRWKHFHHHFMSSWNSASWTARDGKGADLTPWNDSRLNTSGHRETKPPARLRQRGRGDGGQLYTMLWKNIATFRIRGRAKPDIFIAR